MGDKLSKGQKATKAQAAKQPEPENQHPATSADLPTNPRETPGRKKRTKAKGPTRHLQGTLKGTMRHNIMTRGTSGMQWKATTTGPGGQLLGAHRRATGTKTRGEEPGQRGPWAESNNRTAHSQLTIGVTFIIV